MNKVKKISLIGIVIGIICTIISIYSYITSKNTNSNNIYIISYMLTSIVNIIIVTCYFILFFTKENQYKNKKGLIFTINILAFFSSLLFMIVNIVIIRLIAQEIFIMQRIDRTFTINPQKNPDGTINKVDLEANILAKEFKRIKDLRLANEISEKEYQEYKKTLCDKIGIDPDNIL